MRWSWPRLGGRNRFEGEMKAELRGHMERRVDDLVGSGLDKAEAERQARLEFGGITTIEEECRTSAGYRLLDEAFSDTRYTLRMLRKAPAFAFIAIGVLGIGIGACTAVFSVVNSILLRPMPYPNPDRLIRIFTNNPPLHIASGPASYPDFQDWSASGYLEATGLYSYQNVIIAINGQSERALAGIGTSGLFSTFGIQPIRGRLFTATEDRPSQTPVVILTEGFWRRRFGGDERIVGSPVRIEGRSALVVGIVPAFLSYEGRFEFWISPPSDNGADQRANRFWLAVGRLRPHVTRAQTEERLRQLSRNLAVSYPESNKDWGIDVAGLKESLVVDSRAQLLTLLGSVVFVLLVVCANVAALFLVRATMRQREMSIRTAIGAGRGRIVRQVLTESLMMAMLAAVLGTALAYTAVRLVREHGPADIPRIEELDVDARAMTFAAALAFLTGLVSGLAPAIYSVRRDLQPGMREGGRSSTESRSMSRTRSVLLAGEVALSVMLLTGAGLLLKSFWALAHEDLGFRPDHLLTLFVSMPSSKFMNNGKYDGPGVEQYVNRLTGALESLPGVIRVGVGMYAPVGGGGYQTWQRFRVLDSSGREEGFVHGINQVVTPAYFETLGIPLRSGRIFTPADNGRSTRVALVNERLAQARFPAGEAVGHRIWLEGDHDPHQIVGVVGNIKTGPPNEPAPPQLFLPEAQNPVPMLTLFLRTHQDPAALRTAVERRVGEVDPDIPAYRIRPAEEIVSRSLGTKRFVTSLMAGFAFLAVLLAAMGLYGVLAYTVAQRTREFGVRVALGARASQVISLVLTQGLRVVAAGLIVGLAGALALGKALTTVLYTVAPRDPLVLAVVAAVMAAVGFLSCWMPARRAAKVDPALALRWE